ncbi:IPT/TIG domain-containing protein [Nocardia sp. NBC_01009]|uniref:IPT/TIG domain-containing protein n=1 Tax=Nocardia sp. NBC_01009 TaxID=2975996 RepID=UPI0038647C2E|nr:IPT/TIG domain-containing protein [Nocardia sp. NBC_01009]
MQRNPHHPSRRRHHHTYHHLPLPNLGSHDGGTSVTITGTGFTGAPTVRFGTTATVFTVNSATQLTAVAPAGTGTVSVTATTAGGVSNGVFYTYV